jgi:hypothetical protein
MGMRMRLIAQAEAFFQFFWWFTRQRKSDRFQFLFMQVCLIALCFKFLTRWKLGKEWYVKSPCSPNRAKINRVKIKIAESFHNPSCQKWKSNPSEIAPVKLFISRREKRNNSSRFCWSSRLKRMCATTACYLAASTHAYQLSVAISHGDELRLSSVP